MTEFLIAWSIACVACVVGAIWLMWLERNYVDRREDPIDAEERITSIKAALQDESAARPHVSAKNFWSAP